MDFGFSFQSFEHKNTVTMYVLNLITEAFLPNPTKASLGEGIKICFSSLDENYKI